MAGLPQVGDYPGEPTRPAEWLRVARRHRPVTDAGLGIVVAETIAAPGRVREGRLPPRVAGGLQGADDVQVREVRQGVPTADTLDVFKEKQVLAVRTVEHLHSWAFAGGRYAWACAHGHAWTHKREIRSAARVRHAASPAVSPRGPSWLEQTPCGRHCEPGGTRG